MGWRGSRGQSESIAVLFLSGFYWRSQLLSIPGVSFAPGLILGRWDLYSLAAWFSNLLRTIPVRNCWIVFLSVCRKLTALLRTISNQHLGE